MNNSDFKAWESLPKQSQLALDSVVDALGYNADKLIPVIAQQHDTGEVLMLAWMNKQAIYTTLNEQQVCYWSRSRQQYWRKGETSGHTQRLVSMHFDCDGDAILVKVDQVGPACHTNRRSCFYFDAEKSSVIINS